MLKFYRINQFISASEVRLLDQNGKQIGIVNKQEALKIAAQEGVDLVEIVPGAQPPICRVIDFKKFKYLEAKKEQDAKKRQKVGEIKEIRLSPFIGQHDLETQLKKSRDFLKEKHRLKFTVKFTGRQMTKTNFGRELLNKVFDILKTEAKLDREIKMEGRQMTMMVAPQ